jgi:hypothetical protein
MRLAANSNALQHLQLPLLIPPPWPLLRLPPLLPLALLLLLLLHSL